MDTWCQIALVICLLAIAFGLLCVAGAISEVHFEVTLKQPNEIPEGEEWKYGRGDE